MNEALIIIDMQEKFGSAHDLETIHACIRQIEYAKRNETPIIVLEYQGFGHTLGKILLAIGDYPHVNFLFKNKNTGKVQVKNELYRLGIRRPTELHVCGVNIEACVACTVFDLAKDHRFMDTTIYVYKEACNTEIYSDKDQAFRYYPDQGYDNILVA